MQPEPREIRSALAENLLDIDLGFDPDLIDPDGPLPWEDPYGAVDAGELKRADALARSLRRVKEDLSTYEALRLARIAEINDWFDRIAAGKVRREVWLLGALENYMRATGMKKLPTTSGVVLKMVTPRGSVEVRDIEALYDWANSNERESRLESLFHAPSEPRPDKVMIAKMLTPAPEGTDIAEGRVVEYELFYEGEAVPGVVRVVPKFASMKVTMPEEGDSDE